MKRSRIAGILGAAVMAFFVLPLGLAPTPALADTPPSVYHPVAPARVMDTRPGGIGPYTTPFAPGQRRNLTVAGSTASNGTVPVPPASTAVVINVTVTDTMADGFLTVYPTGSTPSGTASNLNWVAGTTRPNLVQVGLSSPGGAVTLYNASSGSVNVIVDVQGYFSDAGTGAASAGLYRALSPARILDTRFGTGGFSTPLAAGSPIRFQVTGRGNVPTARVSAVTLNVTVTNSTRDSFLTVYPGRGAPPTQGSNLNFNAGQTVPNRVIVSVDSQGYISFATQQGSVDVIADVGGWYTDGTNTVQGGTFVGMTPARVLDTRDKTLGGYIYPIGDEVSLPVQVGTFLSPPTGVTVAAVVLNVTATDTSAGGYGTVYPDGDAVPWASDVNFNPGDTWPNLTVVKVGPGGLIDIFNASGHANYIVDVFGWYSAGPAPGALPGAPTAVTAAPNGANSISVSWSPPSSPASATTSYEVRSEPGGYVGLVGGTTTTLPFNELPCGTPMTFSVRDTTGDGSGPKSVDSNPVTAACPTGETRWTPVFGLDFGPYTQAGQGPGGPQYPDAKQILSLLGMLRGKAFWVKLAGSRGGLEPAPQIAKKLGFRVAEAAYLACPGPPAPCSSDGTDHSTDNTAEIAQLEQNISAGYVDIAVVGSEPVWHDQFGYSGADVAALINKVRCDTSIPANNPGTIFQCSGRPGVAYTTVEPDKLLRQGSPTGIYGAADVAAEMQASDLYVANIPPWNYGDTIDQAMPDVESRYSVITNFWNNNRKTGTPSGAVYIGETEWPSSCDPYAVLAGQPLNSCNDPRGANPTNEARYFHDFEAWARTNSRGSFYYEAFNSPWEGPYDQGYGAFWGVFDEAGLLKWGMLGGFTVYY